MKFPLDWHREGIKNSRAHLDQEQRRLEALVASVARMRDRIEMRERQLAEAERRGLFEYDPDRFLVAKRKASK